MVAFQGDKNRRCKTSCGLGLEMVQHHLPNILLVKESQKAAQLEGVGKQVSPLDGMSCKGFVLFFISLIRKSI